MENSKTQKLPLAELNKELTEENFKLRQEERKYRLEAERYEWDLEQIAKIKFTKLEKASLMMAQGLISRSSDEDKLCTNYFEVITVDSVSIAKAILDKCNEGE